MEMIARLQIYYAAQGQQGK